MGTGSCPPGAAQTAAPDRAMRIKTVKMLMNTFACDILGLLSYFVT
jgi:hypothetical protein